MKILVADSDDDFREIFGMTLREEFPDTIVECVSDGQAAVEAFDERRHSVAIVDLSMPKLGGGELVELLQARRAAPRTSRSSCSPDRVDPRSGGASPRSGPTGSS